MKKRNCTNHVAKTKALISFAVTAKLICAFVLHRQKNGFPMTRPFDSDSSFAMYHFKLFWGTIKESDIFTHLFLLYCGCSFECLTEMIPSTRNNALS